MKKEIFRMINVITNSPDAANLDDMNLYIHLGEIIGLIPINGIGIEVFLNMFTDTLPIKFGKIYINNKPLNNRQPSKQQLNKIYILNQQRKLVESLSVLENIYVLNSLPFRGIIHKEPLLRQYAWLMEDLDFHVSPDARCERLSEYERCAVEILKAITQGAKLIILYGMSDIMGAGDLARFKDFLTAVSRKNYSFLYICDRCEESVSFCDRIIYMKDGKDIQSFDRHELSSPRHLKFSYSLQSADPLVKPDHMVPSLRIRHLPTEVCEEFCFDINQGECLVLYDETKDLHREFMDTIRNNHGNLKNLFCILEAHSPSFRGLENSVGTQIAVIGENPLSTMLFYNMSYIDNLCIRMESKLKRIRIPKAVKESIRAEYHAVIGDDIYADSLLGLSADSLYNLIYYRVALINPKAVFIIQPFYNTDIYTKKHIRGLIRMLQEKKISVIILSADLQDSSAIANRCLILENGRIRPES
ncbi:MAG: ATP-binding cassette domain-containing protein [Eubacteriales bacterium]|nr:ATP-binding cassette domain-containing protein [Eubacteriales bacterium]